MDTNKRTGRVVGALLLIQLVGMMLAFMPTMPVLTANYLTLAPEAETSLRIAVMLLFINAGVAIAMSIVAFKTLREYSVRIAIALISIATAWFVLQAVDNAHIMSMLSLSKQYATSAGAGANADLYSVLGAQVRSTRSFMHFGVLLTIDAWFTVFYGALFAFRLVPRVLAGLGVVAVVLHAIGISLSAFIGYPIMWQLAYPFALGYLVFGGWLVVKGFDE